MMEYPTHWEYERLYARYFQGDRTKQMLDLAGDLKGKRVVDLCCGGGRLTRAAMERGAEVELVDESSPMLMTAWQDLPALPLAVHNRSVKEWARMNDQTFDFIFCQQAINYWLTPETAGLIARKLKHGGEFIFNTFNRRPGRVPEIKQYELDGSKFVEASWSSVGGEVIEHVQMREGLPPHTTHFKWISPDDFEAWLNPHFEVVLIPVKNTSIYTCIKP